MSGDVTLSILSAEALEAEAGVLGGLLLACVNAGASIGFVLPFSQAEAEAFWTGGVAPAVRRGGRVVVVARQYGRIVGTGQLDHDTPPNQPHRAEVRKVMVQPALRRRGIARLLMAELERLAIERGRSLLTLDTRTGDAAEPLYASMGYQTAGVIPFYCRDPAAPKLDSTTIMYKMLPGLVAVAP